MLNLINSVKPKNSPHIIHVLTTKGMNNFSLMYHNEVIYLSIHVDLCSVAKSSCFQGDQTQKEQGKNVRKHQQNPEALRKKYY